ncbi:nitrate reductase molybdenum cofactor assembly chaperone [Enterobacter hormaechei]|nr:nitrate reductase molybdenum cofactor assembly chaperone [Enterobacter hormaechei]
MQILKIIALLIEYPDELLWENRDEALSLVEQDAPMLLPFAQQHLSAPLLDKQAEWCEVFERGRATSLLLFEHVHAESRDRGQAMVDLMSQYEKAGLELDCRELPDYLPLYLEYLSIVSDDEAREGLQNVAPILALIGGRLKQREVAHYQLFDALLSLAETRLSSDSVAKQVSGEKRDDTRQALDACGKRNRSSLSKTTPHRATVRRCSNINDALARTSRRSTWTSAPEAQNDSLPERVFL